MVIRLFIIAAWLALLPLNAVAITADELRALSADGDRDRQASDARAKTQNIAPLLPAENSVAKPSETDKITKKRFTKKRKSDPVSDDKKAEPVASKTTTSNRVGDNPLPRPANPSEQTIMSDAVSAANRPYGIRLGTWIEGSIKRNISSAEPGLVEITLTSDVAGDKRTLRAGTIFFASKQLNGSTKRLELMIVKGISPDGKEFKMNGLIFDTQQISGLTGIIVADNDKTIKRAVGKGALAAVGAAASTIGGATPMGSAVGAAANSAVQDKGNVVDQTTDQTLTIYVSPQPLLIRVEESL